MDAFYQNYVQKLLDENEAVGQPQLEDLCKIAKDIDDGVDRVSGTGLVKIFVEHMQKYYGYST